jgi:hypothetical protein
MADDFAQGLKDNFLLKGIGNLVNLDRYRLGSKKSGQGSNLKASDYGNQKPYKAPGSNWGDSKPKSNQQEK